MTAHVDFQALARAAEDVGAAVHGPVTQGQFLRRIGIETRAVTLMAKASPEVSEDISGALNRLVGGGRSGMGSMFKVLGISADPAHLSVSYHVHFDDFDNGPGPTVLDLTFANGHYLIDGERTKGFRPAD